MEKLKKYSIATADVMSALRNGNIPLSTEELCEIENLNMTPDEMSIMLEQLASGGYLERYNSDYEEDADGDYWYFTPPQTEIGKTISWMEDARLLERGVDDTLSDVEKLAHIIELASWIDESPHPERTQMRRIEYLQDEVVDSVRG